MDINSTSTEEGIELISKEPFAQFTNWYGVASTVSPETQDVNSMCLATCTKDGKPSNRMVALKSFNEGGFKFTTNYNSRKGQEITENSYVAVTFYWRQPIKRCVRIEGIAVKGNSDEYSKFFYSTSKSYQYVKASSPQSTPIESKDSLVQKIQELSEVYKSDEKQIQIPESLGIYKIIPHTIEFWQGLANRIHDRVRFRKLSDNINEKKPDGKFLHEGINGWVYERLGP